MNVNYEWYKVFYFAAYYMNFSKAAEQLFVTQSSVSQTIKSLENQLDTLLFYRNGKKISLTQTGKVLFDYVQRMQNEVQTAEKIINSYKILDKGELKIGVSDTICKHYLLNYLESFHNNYPNIKLLIDNQPSPKTKEEVLNSILDLGFINHEYDEIDNRFDYIDFYKLKEVFFTGNKLSHLQNNTLTARDFSNIPFISLKENTSTRLFIEKIFKNQNIQVQPEVELISVDLIIDLVKAGFGVGFADTKVINNVSNKDLVILNTSFDIPKRKISIITHKKIPMHRVTKEFINLITK